MKRYFVCFLILFSLLNPIFAQSGKCGENLTWKIQGNKLVIKGSGDMLPPYPSWDSYASKIEEIRLPSKLTSICEEAFSNFSNIEFIYIPEGLQVIGRKAFFRCSCLNLIYLPSSINKIESEAFAESGIKEFVFSNLNEKFEKNENKSRKNTTLSCLDGKSVFRDCKRLQYVKFAHNSEGSISIPDSSFSGCSSLRRVELSSVNKIGAYAFFNCEDLDSIIMPLSCNYVGKCAFEGCERLRFIDFSGVDGILPEKVCKGCNSLNAVALSSEIKEVSDSAFYDCIGLESIIFPDSLKKIGDHAFEKCKKLIKIELPFRVEKIGFSAFSDCVSLKEVSYPPSLKKFSSFAFNYCPSLKSFHGSKSTPDERCVIVDGKLVWFAPQGLDSYVLPDNVKTIGWGCFGNFSGPSNLTLPKNGVHVERCAFFQARISEITIPSGSIIDKGSFEFCEHLTRVNIEEGVEYLSSESFCNCFNIQQFFIPSNMTYVPPKIMCHTYHIKDIKSYVFINNTKDRINLATDAFPEWVKIVYKSPLDDSTDKNIPPILSVLQKSLRINSPLNAIGPGMTYTLYARVHNEGGRDAKMCVTKASLSGTSDGVEIDDVNIYNINPGETKDISIPFRTYSYTRSGNVTISLSIRDQYGYESEPVHLTVPTYSHGTDEISSEGLKHRTAANELVSVAKNPEDLFKAIEEYKQVIISDPSYSNAYFNLAKLYTTLGKEKDKKYYSEAKSYYIQYKLLVPEDYAEIDSELYALEVLMKNSTTVSKSQVDNNSTSTSSSDSRYIIISNSK